MDGVTNTWGLDPVAECRDADAAACQAGNATYPETSTCKWGRGKMSGDMSVFTRQCCEEPPSPPPPPGGGTTGGSSTSCGAASAAPSPPPPPSARTRLALETAADAARTFRAYFGAIMVQTIEEYCQSADGKADARCANPSTLRGSELKAGDVHTDDGKKDGSCASGDFSRVGMPGKKNTDFKSLQMDGSFRPTNGGAFNIEGGAACEYLIYEPVNTGSMRVDGCGNASVAVIDPRNAAPDGKSLGFHGGEAIVVGGENTVRVVQASLKSFDP